jgi:hypothetical protein
VKIRKSWRALGAGGVDGVDGGAGVGAGVEAGVEFEAADMAADGLEGGERRF